MPSDFDGWLTIAFWLFLEMVGALHKDNFKEETEFPR